MSKKTRTYAKALLGVFSRAPEREARATAKRFKKLLRKRGDLRFLSAVLQEFKKMWQERKGEIARVVTAKEQPLGSSLLRELKRKGYQAKKEENKDLIGGTAVFLGNTYLLDNSVRGKLQKIQKLLESY
jgi:F0F1-type ATP synthase delta subunit